MEQIRDTADARRKTRDKTQKKGGFKKKDISSGKN